jgi:hypothetical protein
LNPVIAIEDERLDFAATKVIGIWLDGLGGLLSSVNRRLLLNYDETMPASNLGRSKAMVASDQRVFRKKHMKRYHHAFAAAFDPLGHGPPPLV